MERTTVSLEPELHARLKKIASERGVSVATVIRDMLEEASAPRKRHFASLGIADSGDPTIADQLSDFRSEPGKWRSS
jgi:hypothetical protein